MARRLPGEDAVSEWAHYSKRVVKVVGSRTQSPAVARISVAETVA